MLQLKSQSVKIKEEPCIRLTQKNLIEFQVQEYLSQNELLTGCNTWT